MTAFLQFKTCSNSKRADICIAKIFENTVVNKTKMNFILKESQYNRNKKWQW